MTVDEIRAIHAPNFQVKIQAEIAAQICELNMNLQALLREFSGQKAKKEKEPTIAAKWPEVKEVKEAKEKTESPIHVPERTDRVERAVLK
jgi:hypothetical protein